MTAGDPDFQCEPAEGALMDPTEAERLAAVAKALSDPVRFRLYAHIASSRHSKVCVCHLPGQLRISQPTLSHHLKKLVDSGLVDRESRGRWAYYSPRPEAVDALSGFLQHASATPVESR